MARAGNIRDREERREAVRSYEAIRQAARTSGKADSAISKAIGKSANFIYTTIYKKSDSQAQTIAAIARECGYRLALVPCGAAMPEGSIEIEGEDGED